MRQFLWKAAQVSTFLVLLYWIHEGMEAEQPGQTSMLSHIVLAGICTAIIFVSIMLLSRPRLGAAMIGEALWAILIHPWQKLARWLRSGQKRIDRGSGQ